MREQLLFHEKTTLLKLRDCAFEVIRSKTKSAKKWFYIKHMKVELINEEKLNYKNSNPLNPEKDFLF